MPTRSVHLTAHYDNFIDTGVRSGRFGDASELVGEGLRLLEEREHEDEAKIEWLRTAAKTAFGSIDRGEGTLLRSPEELEAFLRQVAATALRSPK